MASLGLEDSGDSRASRPSYEVPGASSAKAFAGAQARGLGIFTLMEFSKYFQSGSLASWLAGNLAAFPSTVEMRNTFLTGCFEGWVSVS